jgi:hypothetical protein
MQPPLKPDNMPLPQRLTPHSLFSSTTRIATALESLFKNLIVQKKNGKIARAVTGFQDSIQLFIDSFS